MISDTKRGHWLKWALLILIVGLSIAVSQRKGNDINVYLHAAQQLWAGEDPYVDNPYNHYLYGPFYALTLVPLSALSFPVARVLWALLSLAGLLRVWLLFKREVLSSVEPKFQNIVLMGALLGLLSLNGYIHNLNLGQVTLVMLWLMVEGMYAMHRRQTIKGAALLAFGINLKILPLLILFYYFLQWKWKPIIWTMAFFLLTLLLPAVFVGWSHNIDLHVHWLDVINPVGKKFGVEINDGCISLNCMMSRLPIEMNVVKWGTTILRLIVIGLFSRHVWKNRKRSKSMLDWWKEVSLILLVILLIFPHQMKYSMMFILPATAYLMLPLLQKLKGAKWSRQELLIIPLLLLPGIMGRDMIGNYLVNLFDTIGVLGFVNMILFGLLLRNKKAPSVN